MSNGQSFTKYHLISGFIGGLVVSWLVSHFASDSHGFLNKQTMDDLAVLFLLFAGGFVLLKSRDADRDYYRAKGPKTEDAQKKLAQRYRTIGLAGWVLTGVGVFRLAMLLVSFARR